MFVCFANLWEIEDFFLVKVWGVRVGCIKVKFFLRKYGSYIFFGKVRD
jgi:hypothetical protein